MDKDESDLDFYGEFVKKKRGGGGERRFIASKRIFNEKRYFSSKKKKKRKTILEFLINAFPYFDVRLKKKKSKRKILFVQFFPSLPIIPKHLLN